MSNYGLHLTLRLSNIAKRQSLNDSEFVSGLLIGLVNRIDMRILAGPLVGYETGKPEVQGCSGVIILYESHAAIHTYSRLGEVFLDLFSCKNFNPDDVMTYLDEAIGGFTVTEKSITTRGRDWDRTVEDELSAWRKERRLNG